MGFHESAKFPRIAEYSSQSGPGGNVSITRLRSGAEERNAPWSGFVHRFDVSLAFKERDVISQVKKFYHMRNGLENGFRFEDPEDHNSTQVGYNADQGLNGEDVGDDDVEIGVGDATTTTFQLIKKYDDGVNPVRNRTINKPISGTVVAAVDGVSKTEGVDYSINYTTGAVTFNSAPGAGLSITAGFEFDVPVRFGEEVNQWMATESVSHASGAVPTCTLIELLDPPYADDEWWPGGANTFVFIANTQLSVLEGKLKIATGKNASAKLILPLTSSLPANGQYFKIWCEAGSTDFDVVTADGTTVVASMTAGDALWFFIYVNSSGERTWRSE